MLEIERDFDCQELSDKNDSIFKDLTVDELQNRIDQIDSIEK